MKRSVGICKRKCIIINNLNPQNRVTFILQEEENGSKRKLLLHPVKIYSLADVTAQPDHQHIVIQNI